MNSTFVADVSGTENPEVSFTKIRDYSKEVTDLEKNNSFNFGTDDKKETDVNREQFLQFLKNNPRRSLNSNPKDTDSSLNEEAKDTTYTGTKFNQTVDIEENIEHEISRDISEILNATINIGKGQVDLEESYQTVNQEERPTVLQQLNNTVSIGSNRTINLEEMATCNLLEEVSNEQQLNTTQVKSVLNTTATLKQSEGSFNEKCIRKVDDIETRILSDDKINDQSAEITFNSPFSSTVNNKSSESSFYSIQTNTEMKDESETSQHKSFLSVIEKSKLKLGIGQPYSPRQLSLAAAFENLRINSITDETFLSCGDEEMSFAEENQVINISSKLDITDVTTVEEEAEVEKPFKNRLPHTNKISLGECEVINISSDVEFVEESIQCLEDSQVSESFTTEKSLGNVKFAGETPDLVAEAIAKDAEPLDQEQLTVEVESAPSDAHNVFSSPKELSEEIIPSDAKNSRHDATMDELVPEATVKESSATDISLEQAIAGPAPDVIKEMTRDCEISNQDKTFVIEPATVDAFLLPQQLTVEMIPSDAENTLQNSTINEMNDSTRNKSLQKLTQELITAEIPSEIENSHDTATIKFGEESSVSKKSFEEITHEFIAEIILSETEECHRNATIQHGDESSASEKSLPELTQELIAEVIPSETENSLHNSTIQCVDVTSTGDKSLQESFQKLMVEVIPSEAENSHQNATIQCTEEFSNGDKSLQELSQELIAEVIPSETENSHNNATIRYSDISSIGDNLSPQELTLDMIPSETESSHHNATIQCGEESSTGDKSLEGPPQELIAAVISSETEKSHHNTTIQCGDESSTGDKSLKEPSQERVIPSETENSHHNAVIRDGDVSSIGDKLLQEPLQELIAEVIPSETENYHHNATIKCGEDKSLQEPPQELIVETIQSKSDSSQHNAIMQCREKSPVAEKSLQELPQEHRSNKSVRKSIGALDVIVVEDVDQQNLEVEKVATKHRRSSVGYTMASMPFGVSPSPCTQKVYLDSELYKELLSASPSVFTQKLPDYEMYTTLKLEINSLKQNIAKLTIELKQKEEQILRRRPSSVKLPATRKPVPIPIPKGESSELAAVRSELAAAQDEIEQYLNEVNELKKEQKEKSQMFEEFKKVENKLKVAKEENTKLQNTLLNTDEIFSKYASKLGQSEAARKRAETNYNNLNYAFEQILEKYEKTKQVAFGLKANETLYKQTVEKLQSDYNELKASYEKFKLDAIQQITEANKENHKMRLESEAKGMNSKRPLRKNN